MSTIKNPLLFSKYFGVPPSAFAEAGLIDPFLNVDTQLFIDPILLEKSGHQLICRDAYAAFREYFSNIVRLIDLSENPRDVAWRAAQRQLNLREPPETGLGYGSSSRSGSSRPDVIRDRILGTMKEIIRLGSRDPEMISLMGLLEDDVGPDTISDFTTRVIIDQLAAITREFCLKLNIPTKPPETGSQWQLPYYINEQGRERFSVLVPNDIVRDLPIARDWSEVDRVISANQLIRDRVNQFLASIAKPTVADRKNALRSAAMISAETFEAILVALKNAAYPYDTNIDILGYYAFRQLLSKDNSYLIVDKKYDITKGVDVIKSVVHDTISIFKRHVEYGNLWEELWINDKPKRERAAQLLYYAIADSFCIANDIDISPEANMGGGPIDFKFSKGYSARVLVEMKRSGGRVRHGYEKQLDVYRRASQTVHGIFVVIDYGDLGGKLSEIQNIRALRLSNGEPVSDIVVIDAKKKLSASRRE